jgi:hypothetical protein
MYDLTTRWRYKLILSHGYEWLHRHSMSCCCSHITKKTFNMVRWQPVLGWGASYTSLTCKSVAVFQYMLPCSHSLWHLICVSVGATLPRQVRKHQIFQTRTYYDVRCCNKIPVEWTLCAKQWRYGAGETGFCFQGLDAKFSFMHTMKAYRTMNAQR